MEGWELFFGGSSVECEVGGHPIRGCFGPHELYAEVEHAVSNGRWGVHARAASY
jgi:hypothetical protein